MEPLAENKEENKEEKKPLNDESTPEEREPSSVDRITKQIPLDPVDHEVAEYEQELRRNYRRASDQEFIARKVDEYRGAVEERIEADESRSEEDIKAEERWTMNTNLALSLTVSFLFTVWAYVNSEQMLELSKGIKSYVTTNLGWFFVILSTGTLIYLGYLAFSRFGDVVLGDPQDRPEFSNLSWYSMLFSAGMGVGILFWGGAEPVIHYLTNPANLGGKTEQVRHAMALTIFHWGFHGWGVYTLCAVAVAFYGFRKRKNYLVSSAVTGLSPVKGLDRPLALFTDLTATLAIVFGLAASLGMGTLQLTAGLDKTFNMSSSTPSGRLILLAIITVAFVCSATTGLDKGIKILSNCNMATCVALLIFVFLASPKLFTIKLFIDTMGVYLTELPGLSFHVAPFTKDYEAWMADWTITYFTWWIAWSPFVGIFIARISRGRTIKELVVGSLMVPVLFTIAWFSVFGGSALFMMFNGNTGLEELISGGQYQDALFYLLSALPLSKLTGAVSCLLIFTFLVTSADSACFVLAMMTSEGNLDPTMKLKLLWALVMATVTGFLVFHGTLDPIQAAAQLSAIPFSVVLILMAFSLPIRLRHQVRQRRI